MSDDIRLDGVTVNAPDALDLARFYAAITGGVATGTSHWAAATGPHGFLTFQQVDDFRRPQWPGGHVPMHLHLVFLVDDLDATGARGVGAATQPRDGAGAAGAGRPRRRGRAPVGRR